MLLKVRDVRRHWMVHEYIALRTHTYTNPLGASGCLCTESSPFLLDSL